MSANYVLQISDSLTARGAAVRIDPQDPPLPLSATLEKYVRDCPIDQYLHEGRLTQRGAENLQVLQDLLYSCSDAGRLHDMHAGVAFKQDGQVTDLDTPPRVQVTQVGERDVTLIDVIVDRTGVGYDRNWTGFHTRRWDRHADVFSGFVVDALRRDFSEAEADEVLQLDTDDSKIKLVRSLARRIWESQFENYSRFMGSKLPYKTGDETVRNVIAGGGGICSEKVQALKFLTDHYAIQSEYLIAGADTRSPVPEEKLRELLATFDFRFSKRYLRYWQHTALLYTIGGTEILVDATNGNIPFLFLAAEASRRLLGYDDKAPVSVRMAIYDDHFYYHRVSQDIPRNLYFASENWIPDIDLIQVFDNELGLYISSELFVTPIVFKTPPEYERIKKEYVRVCDEAGLEYSISADWNLDSSLGGRFSEQDPHTSKKVFSAKEHLLRRLDECYGAGHEAGLVLIALGETGNDLRNTR